MKKFYFVMLMILSLTFGVSSCSDDDTLFLWLGGQPGYIMPGTTDANGNYAITFQGYLPNTRSAIAGDYSNTSGYDAFKMFAWKDNGAVEMNPYDVEKVSQGWTYNGVNGQEIKYYDKSSAYYDFISVISDKTPTSTSANNVKVEGVESFLVDDGESTDKELLHAYTHVTAANYSKGMTVPFVHDNAVVRLQFYSDDAATKLIDFRPEVGSSVTAVNTQGWTQSSKATDSNGQYQSVQAGNDTYTQDWLTLHMDEVNEQYKFYSRYSGKDTLITKYRNLDLSKVYIKVLDKNVDKFKELGGCSCKPNSTYTTTWPTMQSCYNVGYRVIGVQDNENDAYAGIFYYVKEDVLFSSEVTVPGNSKPAIDGIVVLPATSEAATTASTVCATADATITNSGVTFTQKTTNNSLVYSLTPSGNVGESKAESVLSPTNFYAIPCETAGNGMTVKISYTYKGTTVYDSRVHIPASKCQWESGKVYTYTIKIGGIGNGSTDPSKADPDDPSVDNTQLSIGDGLNLMEVTVGDYLPEDGGEYDI